MLSRFRHVWVALFFLLIASCSGGGCSGCGGCGGTTPLPGGFPTDKAVKNGASVRVSRPGLDFIETNLPSVASKLISAPGGNLSFAIPDSDLGNQELIREGCIFGQCALRFEVHPHLCPGGPDPGGTRCTAKIGIGGASFKIDSVTPNRIAIGATIPLELENTPLSASANGEIVGADFGPINVTINVAYGSNGSCNGPTPSVDAHPLPVSISIPLVEDTVAPRVGYTKIDIDNASIGLDGLNGDQVRICADCPSPIPDSACNAVLNAGFIKNFLVDQLKGGIADQLKGVLKDQLCTAPNPTQNPACPAMTSPDASNKKCVYDADKSKCLPIQLGTDAHIDLAGALKSISPGTGGGLDFSLSAAGAMNPAPGQPANGQGRTPNGVTIGMMGGVLAQPPSKCVPQKIVTPPENIPLPDELAPTSPDQPTTPHVGIALAGRFIDYSFTGVYNSGLLCLGVSTEQFDMLKSGLLAFLIPSIKTLTLDQADAAAAIATRPQEAPIVKIGGGTDPNKDPLLLITLPKFAIDFYIWSFDRFARVFTYTADLTIPANLQTGKDPQKNPNGGIIPAIGEIKVANGTVSNADLLLDNPDIVAGAVGGIMGTVSKQLVGSGFSPIDLSGALSSLGLGMEINEIKKLSKGTDDFVGVFATLNKSASPATVEADVQAKLVSKKVWREAMTATTFDAAKLPELEIELSSSLDEGRHPVEYSWWIDSGTRSLWSTAKHIVIKDQQLFLQGKHVLHVSARVVGEPQTEDLTPAEIPYVIDALAPFVKIEKDGAATTIKAWDLVSSESALVARYRLDDGEFTEFRPLAEIARVAGGSAGTIEVEVKDEEGNVGTVRQGLIRGRSDSSLGGDSSCGCSTPGKQDKGGLLAIAAGLAAVAIVALRRRRSSAFGSTFGATATRSLAAIGVLSAVAATSQGCGCGSDEESKTGCGADCNQECQTGLKQGQPGAYLSVAKASDGTIWAAGYNDSLLSEADALLWGDLVVGKYDLGKQKFDWVTVDGIPRRDDGTCPAFEPNAWRKGETDSGDNVGRYTSIQVSPNGQPIVSYYDDTNKALKLAVREADKDEWKISTLKQQPGADIGKYGKMVLVQGKPVIAYMHLEAGNGGHLRSKIVVARSKVEVPQGPDDFDFEDAAIDEEGDCRPSMCSGGDVCIKETGLCSKTVGGCAPACGDTDACVTKDNKATCLAKQGTIETYPRALGSFISLAASGNGTLGIVAYDGKHGNLIGVMDKGFRKWERAIIDGETGTRGDNTALDTGDSGIAASLAIGTGDVWHVSYVNGLDETLRYITFANGKAAKSEVVDDGSSVDGKAFPDGKHIVGDDSAIKVDGDLVTIFYADSTSLGLRRAVGTGGAGAKTWDLRAISQPNRWVAFPQFVPNDNKVAAWWRQSTRASKTVEGDVIVLTP